MTLREGANLALRNGADSIEKLVENYTSRHSQGRRAFYWAFFKTTLVRKDGDLEIEDVQCLICDGQPAKSSGRKYGVFAYNALNGTSNLDKHAKKSHNEVFGLLACELNRLGYEESSKRRKTTAKMSLETRICRVNEAHGIQYSKSKPKQARFNEDCVLMVTQGLYPFNLVENNAFRQLVHNLDPLIKPMSRKELVSNQIPLLSKKIIEEYVQPCVDASLGGSLQFDLWMSRANKDIFSVIYTTLDQMWTIKHINLGLIEIEKTDGKSLAESLESIMSASQISGKVVCLVKDQGSNLLRATRIMKDKLRNDIMGMSLLSSDCIAHALNKVCKHAMKSHPLIRKAMSEVSSCVRFTKKSTPGARALKEAQQECNLPRRKLVSHVATRFASYLACFRSFLDNERSIRWMFSTNVVDPIRDKMPSAVSWKIIKSVNMLMSRVISSLFLCQGTMLISDSVVALISLFTDFRNQNYSDILLEVDNEYDVNGDSNEENSICEVIENVIKSSCDVLFEFLQPFSTFQVDHSHVWFSLVLDPRYKKLKVLRELERLFPAEFNVRTLNKEYEELLFTCLMNTYKFLHPTNYDLNTVEESSSSDDDFDEYKASNLICNDYYVLVKNEFLHYRECPLLSVSENPLEWWSKNGHLFPTIAAVAKMIFSIPSSQCECERTFSIAGIISQNKRNNISVENMDLVIKLHHNLRNFETGHVMKCSNFEEFIENEAELLHSLNSDEYTNESDD